MDVTRIANGAGYEASAAAAAQPQAQPQNTAEPAERGDAPAKAQTPEKERPQMKVSESVDKVLEQINKSISMYHREMQISTHQKTQRLMIKVWDTEEKKVIREIPPEKVLDAFAATLELAGILLDKKS